MEAEGGGDVSRRRWSEVPSFICLTLLVSGWREHPDQVPAWDLRAARRSWPE
jgi:hypothetical protein